MKLVSVQLKKNASIIHSKQQDPEERDVIEMHYGITSQEGTSSIIGALIPLYPSIYLPIYLK